MREPLVFLPGMLCDARVFGPQLAELSAEHAVTVAPITQGERIEEIASALLDVLPKKFALLGFSMGGIVAMEILRRAPDRLSRICLMDTNALSETPQSAAGYEPMIIKAKSGNLGAVIDGMIGAEGLAPGPYRAEVLALLKDMAENIGERAAVSQLRALQRRRDQQATLRRCKVPALVLCGEYDRLTPVKRHQNMAELIPYAELHVISGAGHVPTLENPEAVSAAIRGWLAQPYVLPAAAQV